MTTPRANELEKGGGSTQGQEGRDPVRALRIRRSFANRAAVQFHSSRAGRPSLRMLLPTVTALGHAAVVHVVKFGLGSEHGSGLSLGSLQGQGLPWWGFCIGRDLQAKGVVRLRRPDKLTCGTFKMLG